MSKFIQGDDQARAWAIPEIRAASNQSVTHKDQTLSEREKRAVEERVNKLKQRAYQEGFEQGQQEGRASGQRRVERSIASLEAILAAMATPFQQLEGAVEDELTRLALAVAKQVVRRELKTDPAQVVAVVREALAAIPSSARQVRVFLSPDDAALVRKLMPASGGDSHWEIVEDPVLTQGSCRVETDSATVDATFEGRIAAIAAQILGSERADD